MVTVEDVTIRTTREAQVEALDALLRALPADTVRAQVRAVLGDAERQDNDAEPAVGSDSDAEAEDSRTTPETPVVYATMEERIAALRQSYA